MLRMAFDNVLFVIAILLPWAIFVANIKLFRGKYKVISVVVSAVLVYAALILQVHLDDARLEKALYAFDLNGDGVFSGTEINSDQEAAMANFVNDTGRAMAPITGAIFSTLYTAISFMLFFFASWLRSKYRAKRI